MSTEPHNASLLRRASPAYRKARAWEAGARKTGDLARLPSVNSIAAGTMQSTIKTIFGVTPAHDSDSAVVIIHCELHEGQHINLSCYLPLAAELTREMIKTLPESVKDQLRRELR